MEIQGKVSHQSSKQERACCPSPHQRTTCPAGRGAALPPFRCCSAATAANVASCVSGHIVRSDTISLAANRCRRAGSQPVTTGAVPSAATHCHHHPATAQGLPTSRGGGTIGTGSTQPHPARTQRDGAPTPPPRGGGGVGGHTNTPCGVGEGQHQAGHGPGATGAGRWTGGGGHRGAQPTETATAAQT